MALNFNDNVVTSSQTFPSFDQGISIGVVQNGVTPVSVLTLESGNIYYRLNETDAISSAMDPLTFGIAAFSNQSLPTTATTVLRTRTLAAQPFPQSTDVGTHVPVIVQGQATNTRTGFISLRDNSSTSGPYIQMYQEDGVSLGSTIDTNRLSGGSPLYDIRWYVAGSEHARLTTNGRFLVNTSFEDTTNATLQVSGTSGATTPAARFLLRRTLTASYEDVMFFGYADASGTGTLSGSVVINENSAALVNASDYRQKHSIQPLSGALDLIDRLRPVTFQWRGNEQGPVQHGFLAHEFQAVLPRAVTGSLDEVDSDGQPRYQMLDRTHVVPWLAAAVKELLDEINDLRSAVAQHHGEDPCQ